MDGDILYALSHMRAQENAELKTNETKNNRCLMGSEAGEDWLNWGKVRLIKII